MNLDWPVSGLIFSCGRLAYWHCTHQRTYSILSPASTEVGDVSLGKRSWYSNQPPRPTQPSHPSVGRCSKHWWRIWPPIGKKKRVPCNARPYHQHCWHTWYWFSQLQVGWDRYWHRVLGIGRLCQYRFGIGNNASITAPIPHTRHVCVTKTIVLCFDDGHQSHCRRTAHLYFVTDVCRRLYRSSHGKRGEYRPPAAWWADCRSPCLSTRIWYLAAFWCACNMMSG